MRRGSTGLCSICYGNRRTGDRKLLPIQSGPDGVRVCAHCDGDALRIALETRERREDAA